MNRDEKRHRVRVVVFDEIPVVHETRALQIATWPVGISSASVRD